MIDTIESMKRLEFIGSKTYFITIIIIMITFFITGASNSADRKEVSSSFSSSLSSSTTWEYNNSPKDFKISSYILSS